MKILLPVGTKVQHSGMFLEVIDYNDLPKDGVTLYDKERYPYKCRRDDGYEDVYGFQCGINAFLNLNDTEGFFMGEV